MYTAYQGIFYALGLDYGTQSVRALVVDVQTGEEHGAGVSAYPSGDGGTLLDPERPDLARQYPGDYLHGLEESMRAALEEAAAVRPAPLAVLFADEPAATLTEARELGCVAVHPHVDLCSPAFVERAHDAGFEVNAWTVGSGETARSLAAAGVDGLISDAPEYCPGGR